MCFILFLRKLPVSGCKQGKLKRGDRMSIVKIITQSNRFILSSAVLFRADRVGHFAPPPHPVLFPHLLVGERRAQGYGACDQAARSSPP